MLNWLISKVKLSEPSKKLIIYLHQENVRAHKSTEVFLKPFQNSKMTQRVQDFYLVNLVRVDLPAWEILSMEALAKFSIVQL
jgi:hypothetical protein